MTRNLDLEVGILWLEDVAKYPYLRELTLECSAKQGWRQKWACGKHIIAIAQLSPQARTIQRRLSRRAWEFRPTDPYPGWDKPSEAVIPESIAAGKMSTYGRKS